MWSLSMHYRLLKEYDLALHSFNFVRKRIKIVAAIPEISDFFYSTCSSLSKHGTYNTHNATRPPTIWCVTLVGLM